MDNSLHLTYLIPIINYMEKLSKKTISEGCTDVFP